MRQGSSDLRFHARFEHRQRARFDPAHELVSRNLETEDDGRLPQLAAPQPVFDRLERMARVGELERADDAAAVVRMHQCRGFGITLGKQFMSSLSANPVVQPLPVLAST